jgi:hypothetical protein
VLDSSHGSACLLAVLDGAHCDLSNGFAEPSLYRGCSSIRPRRGVARTRPVWAARLAEAGHGRRRGGPRSAPTGPAIVLDLGELPWAGVPCWSRAQRWARVTVAVAYACRYDSDVRPAMPGNPVSLTAVVRVAEARAGYADHRTGRDSRPTNERLAADTGLSVRTVQRADAALRLLGVATEVLRGRQRTRTERLASWRVGDRARGWASVWALHDHPLINRLIHSSPSLSPHPEGSSVKEKNSRSEVVTTASRRPAGAVVRGAPRRESPNRVAVGLARGWRADPHSPSWATRHSVTAWAAVLAGPAAHGWSPRDVNQLIGDWVGVGHWLPDVPHKPIGLLGAILGWHGDLAERPAALEEAREAAERAAHHAQLAAQLAGRAEAATARAVGRAALGGTGHAAARAVADRAARRAAHNRSLAGAAETLARDAAWRAVVGMAAG